ncbi:MAG: tRNA-uridine aminocarboxypropyltransferase [Vibrio sp.]
MLKSNTSPPSLSRYCPKCAKARAICICEHIQPIFCQTELILLQHPQEAKRAKGSAFILPLSLNHTHQVRVHHFVGEDFTHHAALNQLLSDANNQHCVLYPAPDSRLITDFITDKPKGDTDVNGKPIRLIILDATWKKAYKMWQLSSNLHAMTKLHLPKSIEQQYHIRKSPSAQHLSSLEAAYHSLSLLEPNTDFTPLLVAFDAMMAAQMQFRPVSAAN